MILKIIIYPFCIILNFLFIILIGFPFVFDLIIFFIFIFLFIKNKNLFFSYNIFLIISILFVNLFVLNSPIEKKRLLNGHKKFSFKNKYKKNINNLVKSPQGNLIALDSCTENIFNYGIKIDDQQFITDELGFRNKPNAIMQSNYILVGNSIIMGSRLSQKNILSEKLSTFSNIKFSSIAIGGTRPKVYETNMIELLPNLKNDQKFLLFYFEGNDFYFDKNKEDFYWYGIKIPKYKYKLRFGYERIERNKDKLLSKKYFKKNYLYQNIRPHSQRFYNKILSKWTNSCLVEWKNIDDQKVGFLYKYYQINQYKTHIIKNNDLIKKIEKVIFIPSKFSVYENYFNNEISKINRENKLNFLRKEYKKLNIEVIDLTKELQLKSKSEIKNKKFLFFQDDTHLNELGNKVIADYLLKVLIK